MRRAVLVLAPALLLQAACVTGAQVRASAEVIKADVDRARRMGAMRCAPRELATAEANLDFALGELAEGTSTRAGEHVREAEVMAKKALMLSKDCAPRQVLVKDQQVVVKIEETDRDGDGIPDDKDRCPSEPEDKDGFQDEDGCPDLDNDADGLPDAQDSCPNEAGPADNKGCPDKDRDGDGINDRLDACPDVPGVKEEKGCPKKYSLVVVTKDRIEIKKQIKFATGSAKIVGAESQKILSEVAQALQDNPQIKKVRIEGHTDSVGNDATNLKLSDARANSVMSALIKLNVDPARMEAIGYGETKPIATNSTAAGKAENRRTEFNIVDQ